MSIPVLFWRNIKWRFKNKITIIVTIIQPLIWLVLYSATANQQTENYTGFILPGIMVLVMFSACGSSGIFNYVMKSQGSFYRLLIAPIHRYSIILGQNLEAMLLAFLEIGILVLISLIMSVHFNISLIGIFIAIVILFLTTFFMSNLAYVLSLKLPNEMIYETVMNTIVLPLFFASTALFPLQQISGIMKNIVMINPLTHIINALRELLLYQQVDIQHICLVVLMLLVLDIVTFSLSLSTLRKESRT